MSAQEVKSLDTPFEDLPRLDGKKPRIFRTITTIENSKITNTKIQEEIDETLYKQRINDLQGHLVEKDDNGNYYQTVRDKGSDTDFANIEIRKAFENVGPNSLTNQLQTGQIDSITRLFSEDQEGSKDTFWRSQLSGNDNVTEDPIETTEIATNFAIDKVEIKARRRKKYENLFYPEDIASSKQDKIRFTMFFQGGSRIGFDLNSSNPFKIGKKIQTNIEGSVTLPIQGGIADQNQVGYNNSTLNPVQGALGAIALNPQAAVQNLVDVFRGDTDIQAALRSQEATNTIAALRLYLAQTAVGASGLIPRTTGAILNPNLELILQPQVAYWNLHLQDLQQILALYDQLLDQLMEIKIYPNRYFQASFLKAMQNYLKVCLKLNTILITLLDYDFLPKASLIRHDDYFHLLAWDYSIR